VNLFRTYTASDLPSTSESSSYLSIHVFHLGSDEAATKALPYFSKQGEQVQGLTRLDEGSDVLRVVSGRWNEANVVVIYVTLDSYLVRVAEASPQGTSIDIAQATASGIVDNYAEVLGLDMSESVSDEELSCDALDSWLDASQVHTQRAEEIIVEIDQTGIFDAPTASDALILQGYADEFAEFASNQRALDVPAGAESANEILARAFDAYSEGFETLAMAVEQQDQMLANLGSDQFDEGTDLLGQFGDALTEFGDSCT